jgi:tol-pal system protein YbgF
LVYLEWWLRFFGDNNMVHLLGWYVTPYAFAIACFLYLNTMTANAQVSPQVEDLSPILQPVTSSLTTTISVDAVQTANTQLFLLLESMRQEVSQLRGQVEELGFKLQQMGQNQRDRYIDLDQRIDSLNQRFVQSTQVTPAVIITSNPKPKPAVQKKATDQSAITTTQTTLVVVPATDAAAQQAAYKVAFNLIRAKRYPEAINALEAFIARYPQADLAGNAHYWLGEVYVVKRQTETAIRQFERVMHDYPEHRKVPDALYKAALAWHKLGNTTKGDRLLDQVIRQYPDSSAARLARELK